MTDGGVEVRCDEERFEWALFDFAPDKWVTPENRGEYEVKDAQILGDPGGEKLVFKIVRIDDEEGSR